MPLKDTKGWGKVRSEGVKHVRGGIHTCEFASSRFGPA